MKLPNNQVMPESRIIEKLKKMIMDPKWKNHHCSKGIKTTEPSSEVKTFRFVPH